MNSPQFSIIVPVYNAALFLLPLMKQLQEQTIQNFEVIFINDCSPDNSSAILTQLAEEDERILIFNHDKNICQGAARNTGLDNAQGEYIVYIDADDSISPHYLESLYNGIKKYDADIAICNSIWVYSDHTEYHNMFLNNPGIPEMLLTGEEALQRYFNIFLEDIWIPVEPWGRIIRRTLIEKYHLRNPNTLFEDIVMSFLELLFSHRVILLNDYLYYYNRSNVAAATVERKRQYIRDFPFVFEGIQNVLLDHGLFETHKKWLTRFYFRYLAGVYDFFAKGGHFPKEMNQAIIHYRSLLNDPLIEGSEDYISTQLMKFKYEMARNHLPEMFDLFIEVHPEVKSLLRTKRGDRIINYVYQFKRYRSIKRIYYFVQNIRRYK
jgi:glycosyltransferase involved in cell wall biosynthesis